MHSALVNMVKKQVVSQSRRLAYSSDRPCSIVTEYRSSVSLLSFTISIPPYFGP